MKMVAETALDTLLQDVLKKSRDTERGLAMAQVASLGATAPEVQFAVDEGRRIPDEHNQGEFRKWVRIFLVDPGCGDEVRDPLSGEYKWDNCPCHDVEIIKLPCLLEIVDKIEEKIPLGRKVRVVYGALKNPSAPSTSPDATHLQSG